MSNLPKLALGEQLKRIVAQHFFPQEEGSHQICAEYIDTKEACLRMVRLDQRFIEFDSLVAACFELIQKTLDQVLNSQHQVDSKAKAITFGSQQNLWSESIDFQTGVIERSPFSQWRNGESSRDLEILDIAPQIDHLDRPCKEFLKLYSFGTKSRCRDGAATPISVAIDGWLNGLAFVASLLQEKKHTQREFSELEFVWSIQVSLESWYCDFGSPAQLDAFSHSLNAATMGFGLSHNLPVVVQEFRLLSDSMAIKLHKIPNGIAPLWSHNELERECKYILHAKTKT